MRLASYNVLANAYVRPDFYRECAPAALDPRARRQALLTRIQSLKADVLCLQEAEADLVRDLDRPGRFFQKGTGKPDGCAILTAHSGRWTEHHYRDGSGHGALLLRLPGLTVATTHIKWEPPAARAGKGYGMGQIKELLELLDGPSIVCGDFNCESSDPIVQRCLEAGLTDAFLGVAPNQTFAKQGQGRRIDFVLYSYGLKVRGLPMPALVPGEYLPNLVEPSDHLPLTVELQDL